VKWCDAEALKQQLERRWALGDLCRASVQDDGAFPLRLTLKQPTARVILDQFADVRDWVKAITTFAERHGLTVEWREINHRSLGRQRLPAAVLVDSPTRAAAIIGKRRLLERFGQLYRSTLQHCPELQAWMLKRPLKLLDLESVWPRLVDIALWMQARPNPRVYLRQVSLSGVDSKLIEAHRQVLSELFDLLLPVFAINDDFSGVAGFARRYGFRDKPLLLRLRPLDPAIRLLRSAGDQDVSLTADAFARLETGVKRLYITENEVNYLAFPDMPESLILFGAGYGFEALSRARWLDGCELRYWGDIDTHGFAILDQLRASFPHVQSLLMDRATLMEHKSFWGYEPKQELRDLKRLTQPETELYDDLRNNTLADHLRLEQERISFDHVKSVLATDEYR